MIKLLLAKGAYVDPIADEIGTPLHLATREQQVAAMKTLLDHNADVSLISCYFCLKFHVQL
jgi:ankyrin repeat protein